MAIPFKYRLKSFLLLDGATYSVVEKYAMMIPLLFSFLIFPISFYPEKIIPFHSNISKLISKDYFNKLNDSNIKEITMTNYKNILTGECHARQTLTKYDPSNSSYHTYKYWVEKCTGNDAFLYDFKLINDGTSLAFYSFNIPSDLEDSIKDNKLSFGLNITEPLKFFK